MPYHIVKDGDKFCVEVKSGPSKGRRAGCHDTEEKAKRQMSALYANEVSDTIRRQGRR